MNLSARLREQILDQLPATGPELATACGCHLVTVRAHLAVHIREGLVERTDERRDSLEKWPPRIYRLRKTMPTPETFEITVESFLRAMEMGVPEGLFNGKGGSPASNAKQRDAEYLLKLAHDLAQAKAARR